MHRLCLRFLYSVLLGTVFLLSPTVTSATVLWSHPDVVYVCDTNAIVMQNTVTPQDANASGTLYFRILLDPIADSASKASKTFEAGFMLVEKGRENLGVGNSREALAYSCLNVPKAPKGFLDLNSETPDLRLHEYMRAGSPRFVVLKVEYVPSQDARVTAWLNPDLSFDSTEFSQPSNRVVHFEAKATFDQFSVMHRGQGPGWRFSQMLVATSFEDLLIQPFWRQKWFITVLGIGSLVAVAMTVWLVERRRSSLMIRRLEQERAVVAERTRIAQDIHDEVGANLTKMSKLTEMLDAEMRESKVPQPLTENIANTLQDTMRAMDEIVWAINPKNDTLKETADYLVFLTEDFLRHTGIGCELDVPFTLPEIRIPAEVRHTLFMATKEALNNAVKHSCATQIKLRLEVTEGHFLKIVIADNGKGFIATESEFDGNGLENMQRRLDAIGGSFTLQSVKHRGTTIRLEILLPKYKGGIE